MNTISNFDDVIDSRDVIARIEELEEERQSLVDEIDELKEEKNDLPDDDEKVDDLIEKINGALSALDEWDESSDADDLRILKDLAEEGECSPDWEYGETLIRDSYFENYAQELAEDCGMINGSGWPNTCIDWEEAANELQMDYTSLDFDGVEYWIKS
jgi:hypothetical protein